MLSVAFSADNRQIVSASRDKTIKLWNTLAQCKYTIQEDGHQDWVSTVRFSPNNANPIIVSAGWDKYVKVWNLTNCKLKTNHIGHTGYLNTVTLSPDGSLCASGGEDGKAMRWDLNDGKHLYTLDNTDTIKVWDLESKNLVEGLRPEVPGSARAEPPQCLSLAWSADGQTLFAGYSDNLIRVWQVSQVGSKYSTITKFICANHKLGATMLPSIQDYTTALRLLKPNIVAAMYIDEVEKGIHPHYVQFKNRSIAAFTKEYTALEIMGD